MRIEHVALYVKDLENTKKFFVKYLGAKSNDGSEFDKWNTNQWRRTEEKREKKVDG